MTKRINVRGINAIVAATPWTAAEDAKKKSAINRPRFTQMQQELAETTRELIADAYSYKNIYTNFRQNFIAVKVDRPSPRNRDSVLALDRLFSTREYTKVLTPQGIIFRIPR